MNRDIKNLLDLILYLVNFNLFVTNRRLESRVFDDTHPIFSEWKNSTRLEYINGVVPATCEKLRKVYSRQDSTQATRMFNKHSGNSLHHLTGRPSANKARLECFQKSFRRLR